MHTKIPAIEKLSEESQALYDAVNDERDLPCVLISTSFLDHCLVSLLERFFIQSDNTKKVLDPRSGSLGTFSARVDMSYCLGLISKGLFQNLHKVGRIRNKFAHSYLSKTFTDPEVVYLCEKLTFPKVAGGKRVECNTGNSYDIDNPWERFTEPKLKFTICVVLMANSLLSIGHSMERRPKQHNGWN